MRIAFFGLPLAAHLLALDGHELPLAVLSPVEHVGRRRLRRRARSTWLIDGLDGVPTEAELVRLVNGAEVDLLVSWFWTRKLPGSVLAIPQHGAIGAHPSLLPRHRGPNPYFWAIDAGDPVTGVSVHRLEAEYDTGSILAQAALPVGARDSWQLARALDRPSLRLLRAVVRAFAAGEPPPDRAQDEELATYAPNPSGRELKVDWRWPTERVLRRVRALAPTPGLALEIAGERVFITAAAAASRYPDALEPGEAARVDDRVVVRTSDGAIRLERAVGGAFARWGVGTELDGRELAALLPPLP